MAWVIYLFGSGIIFFIGVALIIAGVYLTWRASPRWLAWARSLYVAVGLLLIAASATPLPYWCYGLAGGTTVLWLIVEGFNREWFVRRRTTWRIAVVAAWTLALALELPYHFMPHLEFTPPPRLLIIGDSVTAGMGERDLARWPKLLAEKGEVEVHDFAQMGATVATALKQAEQLPNGEAVVLLEIGGNDILGSSTVEKFERGLGNLLERVCAKGRTVVMFELPLPPFQNNYGLVQRALANRFGVHLIPRRVFVSVLTAEGGTVDAIHLSPKGHARMAEVMGDLLR